MTGIAIVADMVFKCNNIEDETDRLSIINNLSSDDEKELILDGITKIFEGLTLIRSGLNEMKVVI